MSRAIRLQLLLVALAVWAGQAAGHQNEPEPSLPVRAVGPGGSGARLRESSLAGLEGGVSGARDAGQRDSASQHSDSDSDQEDERDATGAAQGGWGPQALLGRCMAEAARSVRNFLRPKLEYVALIRRYQKWYWTYSGLFKSAGPESSLLAPSDLAAIEFSRVDHELYAERLAVERQVARLEERAPNEATIERVDFVFEALRRLIGRLEGQLAEADARGAEHDAEQPAEPESGPLQAGPAESSEFEATKGRLRRIVLSAAQGVLVGELRQLSRMAALNALAFQMMSVPLVAGSSLSYIAPLINMLGHADASLAANYLTSLEIRAAMRVLDGFNPVPRLAEKLIALLRAG